LKKFRRQVATEISQALSQENVDLIMVGKESWAPGIPDLAHQHRLPCVVASRGAISGLLDAPARSARVDGILHEMCKADLVIACAEHLAAALREHGVARVATAANAVDTTRFRPHRKRNALLDQLAIPADASIVAHASHLMPVKRPLDIVEAAAAALRRQPALLFMIVGGSSDYSQRAEMAAACKRLKIEGQFRFVDWQDHGRMTQYLRLADMIVYPSASEGLCRGYLEAMGCGRVVIASDIPAAREVIDDGANGLLFPTGDIEAFARQILRAAADPALRKRIGRRARKTVVERYSHERLLSDYEAAFDRAIHHHAGRRRRSA
jgi:glycosyltransferase involved in cell wall biosynthesis